VEARRRTVPRGAVAVALVLLGLAGFGLWRVLSGMGDQPWDKGASAPPSAQVTAGRTYSLAVPGGVPAMLARGVPIAQNRGNQTISLQCWWSPIAGERQSLDVSAESADTKAENTVGHFTAPRTGPIHVDCDGWGAMFIPDADNRPTDAAGWALLVSIVTLTVGAGLGLSAARTTWQRKSALPADETRADDDEVDAR
jgi:hypothetical protein